MSEQKITFVEGLRIYEPRENAPDFIVFNFQAFVDDLVKFLQENKDEKGQVRFDLKKSKGGKLYLSLNTYRSQGEPEKQDTGSFVGPPEDEIDIANVPF
ncbi:MAG: hypothetical protein U1C72_00105 [Candidatus Pacearchaeota archaeon]|nr:hypothetical protein [Candidatus Pacearchaeota archaeon]